MTRKELWLKRQRRRRMKRIRRLAFIGIAALVLIIAAVLALGHIRKGKTAGPETEASEEEAEAAQDQNTDTAELKKLEEEEIGNTGWNLDDTGWWYKTEDGRQPVNGWQTIEDIRFYFDENGYLMTGWHYLNDGSFACFNESGLYMPDAVPKYAALTFDDGPSWQTGTILDVLEANHAKATFFVVGTQAQGDETSRNNMIRAYNDGMEIGSHTWDHTTLLGNSAEVIASVMQQNDDYLTQVLGEAPVIMRPTGGGVDETVAATVGKPMILWNVDTEDWATRDPASTIASATTDIQDGSIILMHDIYEETAEAVKTIVPELTNKGYCLVTVSELARIKGVTLQPGVRYGSFTAQALNPPAE